MDATQLTSNAGILAEIARFRARSGMPATTFGRRAIGDANLIGNLEGGRELRRSTEARVRKFMAEYRSTPEQVAA